MKISKQDALSWFRFFAELPEEEPLGCRQQEIVYAVMAQIDTAVEARRAELLACVPGLTAVTPAGAGSDPDRREEDFCRPVRPEDAGACATLFVGPPEKFPRGCLSCLRGTGLSAVRRTNRCNAACPFCYDYGCLDAIPPIGEGLWEIGGSRYREEDLDLLFAVQGRPTGVAYVYLEPFMEIEKYYGIIRRFREAGVHQHLYTNGLLATPANLKALGEAGLDEIRFNLGASGVSDKVLDAMAGAVSLIPQVGVETPVTREFHETFLRKQDRILASGIDFINCAELHLNGNNLPNYWGENLYYHRMGYLSPIFSRDLSLDLLRRAGEERWPLVVHDCSNRTKFARELNLASREGGWFGRSGYGREGEIPYAAFLPVLEDPSFRFLEEEPLPAGYRPGEVVL